MKIRYFNIRSSHEVETVDELDPLEFESIEEFELESTRLASEYRMAGMHVYFSRICYDN